MKTLSSLPKIFTLPNFLEFHPRLIIMDNSNTGHCTQAWQKVLSQEPNSVFQDKRSGNNYLENIGNFLWNSDYNALFCSLINT